MRISALVYSIIYLLSLTVSTASDRYHRPVIIENDGGGIVDDYNIKYEHYLLHETPVIIKGDCVSACARYMRLPMVCAAPLARFGFHGMALTDGTLLPEESIADSKATDTPAAFALETRYDTAHMGFTKKRPYASRKVAKGVRIIFRRTVDPKGHRAYQQFLMVDADMLIPRCSRVPDVSASDD